LSIYSIAKNIGISYDLSDGFKGANELFLSGEGQEIQSKAFDLFEKAAVEGDGGAHYLLSRMLIEGLGRERDSERAVEHLEKAADGGILEAQRDYAILWFLGSNNLQSVQTRLSDRWDIFPYLVVALPPRSLMPMPIPIRVHGGPMPNIPKEVLANMMGQMVHQADMQHKQMFGMYGKNIPPNVINFDPKHAPLRRSDTFRIPEFEEAHLGYLEGFDWKTERKTMERYLKRAADGGLPSAKTFYGSYLVLGEHKTQEGLSYLEQAAQDNYLEAMLVLAGFLFSGAFLAKDMVKAINYLSRVAEKGDPEAIIGLIYAENDLYGKPKDKEKSIQALAPLVKHGFEPAKTLMANLTGQSEMPEPTEPDQGNKSLH
jgi:TPR repeat protein